MPEDECRVVLRHLAKTLDVLPSHHLDESGYLHGRYTAWCMPSWAADQGSSFRVADEVLRAGPWRFWR